MPFKPGQSGNPAGRQRGSRTRITEAFLRDFEEQWRESGPIALKKLADDHPDKFAQIAASLLPKQVEIERPLEQASDAELEATLAYVQQRIGELRAAGDSGPGGAGDEGGAQSPGDVSTLH